MCIFEILYFPDEKDCNPHNILFTNLISQIQKVSNN